MKKSQVLRPRLLAVIKREKKGVSKTNWASANSGRTWHSARLEVRRSQPSQWGQMPLCLSWERRTSLNLFLPSVPIWGRPTCDQVTEHALLQLEGNWKKKRKKETGLKRLQETLRKPRDLMNPMKMIYVSAMTTMNCLCECRNNIVSRSQREKKKEEMFSYDWQLCPRKVLQNKKYKLQTNAAEIVSLAFIISGYFPYRNVYMLMYMIYLHNS